VGNQYKVGQNPGQQIFIQPNIGLNSDVRCSVVSLLNQALADETVLAVKTRSAHWNVHGKGFFEFHTLFANQYLLLINLCDEIAERARILGGCVVGSLGEFLELTRLEDQPGLIPDVLHLLADHETSIRFLREDARKCSEEYEDEGTFRMLINAMRLHEKMAWILRSYIDKEPEHVEIHSFLNRSG
jgi:starvation-inducible DNA-binding protein